MRHDSACMSGNALYRVVGLEGTATPLLNAASGDESSSSRLRHVIPTHRQASRPAGVNLLAMKAMGFVHCSPFDEAIASKLTPTKAALRNFMPIPRL